MKAGIIVAMDSESEALRRAGVSGVVRSGIGKAGAARTATELILTCKPDCIINSGCAGGLGASVNVLDIVLGAQTAYHDVWCGPGTEWGRVQGQPARFDADPSLLQAALSLGGVSVHGSAEMAGVSRPAAMHCGLICSGDRFLTTPEDDAAVLDTYPDALACDMESAAIAQVCRHYGVPFLSFRIISDTHASHDDTISQYEGFWERVSCSSFGFLRALMDKL